MAATAILRGRLRQSTYRTLIGLLAVTGMRVGEAIRLDRDDVDLAHGCWRSATPSSVNRASCPSTLHRGSAARLRPRARPALPRHDHSGGAGLPSGHPAALLAVHATFKQLRDHAGLRPRSAACRPRIHDFRHRFAVQTLLDWYRSGADVQPLMPLQLATYSGTPGQATAIGI